MSRTSISFHNHFKGRGGGGTKTKEGFSREGPSVFQTFMFQTRFFNFLSDHLKNAAPPPQGMIQTMHQASGL